MGRSGGGGWLTMKQAIAIWRVLSVHKKELLAPAVRAQAALFMVKKI